MASETGSTERSAATAAAPGIAWIVGVGASAGLGSAVARRFAKGGLIVALTGRNAGRVRSIVDEITAAGGQARALAGDVSSQGDIQRLAGEVHPLGQLPAAAFKRGHCIPGRPLELTPEQFESTW